MISRSSGTVTMRGRSERRIWRQGRCSLYGYAAPDSDYVTVVQVHPDAASMATHMKVGLEHFATAYFEPESAMQIYGNLTDDLIQMISAAAQSDGDTSSVTIREPFAGFDRLPPPQ